MHLSPTDHHAWSDTFRKYAEWNQRDAGDLFVAQCGKLAVELYTQTKLIAPTKDEITADVKKLSWHIPAFFPDGRIGRGIPRMWADFLLEKREKRKRGRPSKGAAAARANPLPRLSAAEMLALMQEFVIKLRVRARLFLASGWLGAVEDLGGSLSSSSGQVDRERGGAEVNRTPTGVEVVLWNRTPGIEDMDEKHQMRAKAAAVRIYDMRLYILNHMNEAVARLIRAA